jgi:hypothetical protein
MNVRVLFPIHLAADDAWPAAHAPFGVKPSKQVFFRGLPIGQYSSDPADFVGVVCKDSFQPAQPIAYTNLGFRIRYIAVLLDGAEETAGDQLLIVSPHSADSRTIHA